MESKDIIEFLGYNPEEVKSIEDLKSKFNTEFVRASNINEDSEAIKPILGKVYGTLEHEIRKSVKNSGVEIDLDSDEFKSLKKVNDKLSYVVKKVAEKKDSEINEYKSLSQKGGEEKVQEWQTKYEKLKKSKEDADNMIGSLTNEYESFKQKATGEIKNVKLDVLKKDVISKVKFKQDISDFEKKGYMATIQEKYVFDLDENEQLTVLDKNGNKIPSQKVHGTFKTAQEILEEEALSGKLYQVNEAATKQRPTINKFGAIEQTKPSSPTRRIAPRMS
jgi:hypothetical protein